MKKTHLSYIVTALPLTFVLVVWWHSVDQVAAFNLPTSQMTTDKNLDSVERMNRKNIGKVEFLDIPGENPLELTHDLIEKTKNDPKFQREVSEIHGLGDTLPPMKTLIALFVMTGVAGAGRLRDFFSMKKTERVVEKTVQVVKKVPVYTRRIIKETVQRIIKIPRKVAYTAYRQVKHMSHKIRKIVKHVAAFKPQSRVEKIGKMIRFIEGNMEGIHNNTRRGIMSQLRYEKMEFRDLKRMSGSRLTGRAKARLSRDLRSLERSIGSMVQKIVKGRGHGSTHYHKMRKIYQRDVEGRYTKRIVRHVKEPIVRFVKQAFTAYRTVFDVKKVSEQRERTITEVSYKNVTEDVRVQKKVSDTYLVPRKDKIALALNYVKNLPRIHRSPSNASFTTALKEGGFKRGTELYGLVKSFRNLNVDLNNTRKGYSPKHIESRKIVQKYNTFIRRMKHVALRVRKSSDPLAAMFGKEYSNEILDRQRYIQAYSARLTNLRTLKSQLDTQSLSKHYARTKHKRFSKEIRTIGKRISSAQKKVSKTVADYTRRFHSTLDAIDRLAYLKNIHDYSTLLTKSNKPVKTKSTLPHFTVSGLKPVFTGYSRKAQKIHTATQKKNLTKAGWLSNFLNRHKKRTYLNTLNTAKKKAFHSYDRKLVEEWRKTWDVHTNNYGMIQDPKITTMRIPELEQGPINKKVNGIVLHRTDSKNAKSVLTSFKNGIGTHFLVTKNGTIYQTASLNQYTYHIGKIKSACYESKTCSTEEEKKIKGYGWNPTAVHLNEYGKDPSLRYPINEDGIGIEVVGKYNKSRKSWEPLTNQQISSVTHLMNLLKSKYSLENSNVYTHEKISYKTAGEGQTVLDAINNN